MSPGELSAALFDYSLMEDAGGTSDNPTPRMKAAAARCINAAVREIRDLRRSVFTQRHGWNISAPSSGSVTISSGDPYAITAGSGISYPNSGCTLRLGGMLVDTHVLAPLTGSDRKLDVPFPGPYGSGIGATLYHDCVLIHRGRDRGIDEDQFEAVVGDVRFNRRPLVVAKRAQDVEARLSMGGDYGQVTGLVRRSLLPAGDPSHCWVETFAVDGGQVELRLRIAPLPSAAGTLEAKVVRLPVPLSANDLTTSTSFGLPGNLEETVLLPFALQRWMGTPFCSLNAQQLREIGRQYQHARTTLMSWRPLTAASPQALAIS